MPFKEKAIVRHKLRPDWGAGRVLMRNDEYLQIDFTLGGLKKLKTVIADDHLEAATDEEVKALKPPKVKAVRATPAVVDAKNAIATAVGKAKAALAPPAPAPVGKAKAVLAPAPVAKAKAVTPAVKAKPAAKASAKKTVKKR